jgi:hypothetical protein
LGCEYCDPHGESEHYYEMIDCQNSLKRAMNLIGFLLSNESIDKEEMDLFKKTIASDYMGDLLGR